MNTATSDLLERVEGVWRPRRGDMRQGMTAARLVHSLAGHLDTPVGLEFEMALIGTPFACVAGEVWRATAAVLRSATLTDADRRGVVRQVPILVADVQSSATRFCDFTTKVDRWRAAGTRLVWVIDPMTRRVFVFSANAERILGAADELDGEDVLPGFACPVANLFRTSRDRAATK